MIDKFSPAWTTWIRGAGVSVGSGVGVSGIGVSVATGIGERISVGAVVCSSEISVSVGATVCKEAATGCAPCWTAGLQEARKRLADRTSHKDLREFPGMAYSESLIQNVKQFIAR
jgi:hypothetical protein